MKIECTIRRSCKNVKLWASSRCQAKVLFHEPFVSRSSWIAFVFLIVIRMHQGSKNVIYSERWWIHFFFHPIKAFRARMWCLKRIIIWKIVCTWLYLKVEENNLTFDLFISCVYAAAFCFESWWEGIIEKRLLNSPVGAVRSESFPPHSEWNDELPDCWILHIDSLKWRERITTQSLIIFFLYF